MKLLINEEIDSQYIEELRSLSTDLSVVFIPNDHDNRDPFLKEITDADALYGWIDTESLQVAKSLKWIQAPLAGLENYCFRELIDRPITVRTVSYAQRTLPTEGMVETVGGSLPMSKNTLQNARE